MDKTKLTIGLFLILIILSGISISMNFREDPTPPSYLEGYKDGYHAATEDLASINEPLPN